MHLVLHRIANEHEAGNTSCAESDGKKEAAIQLASGKLDLGMLSRLLEHKEFAKVLFLMRAYLDNSHELGNMARNEMIDFMTDMADEWCMSRPKKQGEVQQGMRYLNAQKLCTHEAELEKIKNLFMKILRDVKKMDHRELPKQTMTAAMLNAFREKIRTKWKRRERIEKEDVIFIVLEKLNEKILMDAISRSLFTHLMLRLMNATTAQPQDRMDISYLADLLCRRDISSGLFWQLLGAMKRTGSKAACKTWNKELPVLLISGQDDPAGDGGKGVRAVKKLLDAAGMKDVSLHLIPGARHILLDEHKSGAADEVVQIIGDWLKE